MINEEESGMKTKDFETIDGNEAAARVAYQLNEVIAINPITPASSNSKSVVGSAFTTAGR